MSIVSSIPQGIVKSNVIAAGLGAGGGFVAPLNRFFYDVNFAAGTTKNCTQPYGNNTADGRAFRDPNNVTAAFVPNAAGLLVPTASAGLRRSTAGQIQYPSSGTSVCLQSRDMTQAVWTKTNVTAAKNQVGADGTANAASSITATAALGTVTQAVTLASADAVLSVDVKRLVGTGTLELTLDGTTWTRIDAGITASYSQQFIFQSAVTNPTFGFRIGTSGDSFAVDFVNHTVPANSINIPPEYRYAVGASTLFTSQSRPNAAVADLTPLIAVAAGPFAFYWQGRSNRATGGFIITGSISVFVSVLAAGAVQFAAGAGSSTTATGAWRTGLSQLNKVAGYYTAGGAIQVACNGVAGNLGSGATSAPSIDHFDLGTNGAGQNSIYGRSEDFKMSANLAFTPADLVAMTT